MVDLSDPYFPGEPRPPSEEQEKASRAAREKLEVREANLRALMDQAWFREWMMEKLQALNTFGQTFANGPVGFPDPNATFYHLGRKSAGQDLWMEFDELAPERAALMRREARAPKA